MVLSGQVRRGQGDGLGLQVPGLPPPGIGGRLRRPVQEIERTEALEARREDEEETEQGSHGKPSPPGGSAPLEGPIQQDEHEDEGPGQKGRQRRPAGGHGQGEQRVQRTEIQNGDQHRGQAAEDAVLPGHGSRGPALLHRAAGAPEPEEVSGDGIPLPQKGQQADHRQEQPNGTEEVGVGEAEHL